MTGQKWIEQTRASIGDYWPIYGPIQKEPASSLLGTDNAILHTTNKVLYTFEVSRDTPITYSINYFPGWKAFIDTKEVPITSSDGGFITVMVPKGTHNILIAFKNTPLRLLGNVISIITVFLVGVFLLEYEKQ